MLNLFVSAIGNQAADWKLHFDYKDVEPEDGEEKAFSIYFGETRNEGSFRRVSHDYVQLEFPARHPG